MTYCVKFYTCEMLTSYNLSVIALPCVRALYPPLQMHICITNWGFDSIDKK